MLLLLVIQQVTTIKVFALSQSGLVVEELTKAITLLL
jgi:hypothetical protein